MEPCRVSIEELAHDQEDDCVSAEEMADFWYEDYVDGE